MLKTYKHPSLMDTLVSLLLLLVGFFFTLLILAIYYLFVLCLLVFVAAIITFWIWLPIWILLYFLVSLSWLSGNVAVILGSVAMLFSVIIGIWGILYMHGAIR